jgi:hypothetical protein
MSLRKTSELTGAALDWAVAKCKKKGIVELYEQAFSFKEYHGLGQYNYSTDWAQGGLIIDREKLRLMYTEALGESPWSSIAAGQHYAQFGPTALIAAMRCYCASKLGDEVEVPEELT